MGFGKAVVRIQQYWITAFADWVFVMSKKPWWRVHEWRGLRMVGVSVKIRAEPEVLLTIQR